MTVEERRLIAHLFAEGCQTELPDNVHVSMDIVRRDLGITPTDLVERLRVMSSLGIEQQVRVDKDHDGDDMIVVRWLDLMTYDDEFTEDFSHENATGVAVAMLDVCTGDDGCRSAGRTAWTGSTSRSWHRRPGDPDHSEPAVPLPESPSPRTSQPGTVTFPATSTPSLQRVGLPVCSESRPRPAAPNGRFHCRHRGGSPARPSGPTKR
ncbi:MAG: hypothetical protein WBV74_01915 [Pseudonocardiaceae bacterium]